jgi:hypothetical protein
MKCYISGKITGEPREHVVAKFEKAERQVRAFGHDPVNPLKKDLPDSAPWVEHIAEDIKLLLGCQTIYLLDDWKDSTGSRVEEAIARECHIEIIYQPEFAAYYPEELETYYNL